MPGNRMQRRNTRARARKGSNTGPRLPGIRWVPVPLAVLAALLGWLVLGFVQGQHAAAHEHGEHGYRADGLALSVDQMVWMSNDMTGQGPLKSKVPGGFHMPVSMMPGMQSAANDRLRLEVNLRNTTSQAQSYAMSDFRVVGPGGKSWQTSDDGGLGSAKRAVLEPGFQVTVDLYFDIPNQQTKGLSIEWTRDGTNVEFPVNTSGVPSPHVH